MQFFCLKNEFVTGAVEYTVNHVLNQLGYFYNWLDSAEHLAATDLLIVYGPDDALKNDRKNLIHLPRLLALDELSSEKIEWREAKINGQTIPIFALQEKKDARHKAYFCDLIANVYFHLARLEEQDITHPDRLDDLRVEKSILFKYGKFTLPVVDILIDHFGRFIEQAVQRPNFLVRRAAFPGAQDFGLAITHDVDTIAAFHRPIKFLLKALYKLRLYRKHSAQEMDQADHEAWAFDRLLPFYLEKKIKATFFFISRFREGLHLRYFLRRKNLLKLFPQLKSDGHEIALHPSRFAFNYPKRYLKEKKHLEKITGGSIKGMRHHYLRGLFPELWQTAVELGLQYDATMIHRHYSGFRSATCRAFTTFDHDEQEALGLVEFPTAFFENTLPKEGLDAEASLKTIRILLEQVKKHHGIFAVLWHTNNIYYNEPYPQLWKTILEMLEKENVFLATLENHALWFSQRKHIQLQQQGNQLHITVPKGVDKFSLLFPDEGFQFDCADEGVQLKFRENCLTVENTAKLISIIVNIS